MIQNELQNNHSQPVGPWAAITGSWVSVKILKTSSDMNREQNNMDVNSEEPACRWTHSPRSLPVKWRTRSSRGLSCPSWQMLFETSHAATWSPGKNHTTSTTGRKKNLVMQSKLLIWAQKQLKSDSWLVSTLRYTPLWTCWNVLTCLI